MAVRLSLWASGYVDRRGEGLLNRPSEFQAVGNIHPSKSGNDSPLREGLGFVAARNEPDCAPVSRLLLMGSPSAICRRVAKLAVDAVKSCARGPLPHVGKEVCKRAPSLADAHFAEIVSLCWIRATRLHGVPRTIGRAARHPIAIFAELRSLVPFNREATT